MVAFSSLVIKDASRLDVLGDPVLGAFNTPFGRILQAKERPIGLNLESQFRAEPKSMVMAGLCSSNDYSQCGSAYCISVPSLSIYGHDL